MRSKISNSENLCKKIGDSEKFDVKKKIRCWQKNFNEGTFPDVPSIWKLPLYDVKIKLLGAMK